MIQIVSIPQIIGFHIDFINTFSLAILKFLHTSNFIDIFHLHRQGPFNLQDELSDVCRLMFQLYTLGGSSVHIYTDYVSNDCIVAVHSIISERLWICLQACQVSHLSPTICKRLPYFKHSSCSSISIKLNYLSQPD